MMELLDKLTDDDDPPGTESFATHRLPLADAPAAYEMLQRSRTARARSCSSRKQLADEANPRIASASPLAGCPRRSLAFETLESRERTSARAGVAFASEVA